MRVFIKTSISDVPRLYKMVHKGSGVGFCPSQITKLKTCEVKTTNTTPRMSLRDLSPPRAPVQIILGIFGSRTGKQLSEKLLIQTILTPILQELGRIPDKVLVPYEGDSSMYIQAWADALHIPYQTFTVDWIKSGKSAGVLRDNRIRAECTHALVFLAPRSTRYETLAKQMVLAKQSPKTVFTVAYQDCSLEHLVHEESPSSPAERGRRSGSGKAPLLQQGQRQLDFGSLTSALSP